MKVYLSTTGTASPVELPDLNDIRFTHPTINYELLEEFTLDELRESTDLIDAISAGYITVITNTGSFVTTSDNLAPVSDQVATDKSTDFLMIGS